MVNNEEIDKLKLVDVFTTEALLEGRTEINTKEEVLDATFIDLIDTPNDYIGQAGKSTVVNIAEDGIEFVDSASPLTDPPVGAIISWLKDFTNTPLLPSEWVECDGSVLSDPESVYNGQTIPDLNGENRFLRGNSTSGGTGGNPSHKHILGHTSGTVIGDNMPNTAINWSGSVDKLGLIDTTAQNFAIDEVTGSTMNATTLPTYYEVVWIMRIK